MGGSDPLHPAGILASGEPCAMGLLVETRGSAPQRPGAWAIFFPDGRVVGSLGGGCLEAEARRRALASLRSGKPEVFELDLDDDFGWDDGLLCGGKARIFVQPLGRGDAGVFLALEERIARRIPAVTATVVAGDAAWLGRRALLAAEGTVAGELPPAICGILRDPIARVLAEGRPGLVPAEAGGIGLEVFLEPHVPPPVLLLAGGGHVGRALSRVASLAGFDVTVVDDRPRYANRERFPQAKEVVVGDIAEMVAGFPIDGGTYVVIVTRGHRHDAAALRACIRSPARYIGMIGSRRKVRLLFRAMEREGLGTAEELARVHAPIGLDIGAVTVEEIAVSIAAELVGVRRKGTADRAGSLRRTRGMPRDPGSS